MEDYKTTKNDSCANCYIYIINKVIMNADGFSSNLVGEK